MEHYDVELGKKKQKESSEENKEAKVEEKKKSKHVLAVLKKRQADRKIDSNVAE